MRQPSDGQSPLSARRALVAAPSARPARTTIGDSSSRSRQAPTGVMLLAALFLVTPAAGAALPVRPRSPEVPAGTVKRAVRAIERQRRQVTSSPSTAPPASSEVADGVASTTTPAPVTTPTTTAVVTTTPPLSTSPSVATTSVPPTSSPATTSPASPTTSVPGTTTRTSTVAPVTTAVPETTTVLTPVRTVVPTTQEVQTVNAAGQIITLTSTFAVTQVTSIQTVSVGSRLTTAVPGSGAAALNDAQSEGSSFFNNTGAVVGTFLVVGLAAAAILLGLVFFFIRRRRRQALDEDVRVAAGGAGDGGAGTSRFRDDDDDLDGSDHTHPTFHSGPQMAQYGEYGATGVAAAGYSDPFGDPRRHSMASMGSAGMAGARQRNSSYGAPTSDHAHYSSFSGHGSNGPDPAYSDWHAYTAAYGVGAGAAMTSHEPSANSHYHDNAGAYVPQGESGSSNDHSDPTPVDQRLNPRAVLDRLRQGNHSDVSLNDDANDYSRPLRVTNAE